MPRATYGPKVKDRAQALLTKILAYVDSDFDTQNYVLKVRSEESSSHPCLTVETKLRDLLGSKNA